MNSKLKNLSFRKLKISDYVEFRKLFYLSFKKNLSFEFYKWRYFNEKFSFCYGVFDKKKLIANGRNKFCRPTKLIPKNFIKDKKMREFYINQ